MGWALTLGTKTIQILGSYIRDRREYLTVTRHITFFEKLIYFRISIRGWDL